MKKLILTFALLVAVVSFSKAQFFITSFGVELGWNIPNRVQSIVHYDYYGYDIIHANRIVRHGRSYFDLILQRGDVFIDVRIRRDGFITRRVVTYDYPLFGHVCAATCGYHSNYYVTYYNNCNSHFHGGHNHVVYNYSRPYRGHDNFNNRRNRVNRLNSRSRVAHDNHRHNDRNASIERRQNRDRVASNTKSRQTQKPSYTRRTRNHDVQTASRSRNGKSSASTNSSRRSKSSNNARSSRSRAD